MSSDRILSKVYAVTKSNLQIYLSMEHGCTVLNKDNLSAAWKHLVNISLCEITSRKKEICRPHGLFTSTVIVGIFVVNVENIIMKTTMPSKDGVHFVKPFLKDLPI